MWSFYVLSTCDSLAGQSSVRSTTTIRMITTASRPLSRSSVVWLCVQSMRIPSNKGSIKGNLHPNRRKLHMAPPILGVLRIKTIPRTSSSMPPKNKAHESPCGLTTICRLANLYYCILQYQGVLCLHVGTCILQLQLLQVLPNLSRWWCINGSVYFVLSGAGQKCLVQPC